MPGDSFCATSDSGQMLYQYHWLSKMRGHMVFRDKCLTKNCPLCQHERGYAQTSTIQGFDEVAMELQTLFENTEKVSGSDGTDH